MSPDPAAVLTAHAEDLLRYFRRRVGDGDAPDLLGETLLTAWRRVAVLPSGSEAARMWLFGIAHHVLLNHRRGVRRRLRLAARLHEVLEGAHSPSADVGIEVRDAIARLPPTQAELIRLVHWEGFTLEQAAEIMQMPASTVRNRYQRAKRELRPALRPAPVAD